MQPSSTDLVCLSHLRWDFVFQRPNHLMSRCANERRVFFVEEPVIQPPLQPPWLEVREARPRLKVITPRIPEGDREPEASIRRMFDAYFAAERIEHYILWYFTPMALSTTRHLRPRLVVYDCMDELSGFDGAPQGLTEAEAELFQRAAVVFTGGHSLYEAKKDRHPNVHAFPSSVDIHHFGRARQPQVDPFDQASLPHPRIGFFGVLDERLDRDLLRQAAALRPGWQWILVGPVVKIAPETLPRAANIHYRGMRPYDELPDYLAHWDLTMIPFARNAATRFISPTKTLEYLAAGKPVISTSIADVVRPFGEQGLVRIADEAASFVAAAGELLEASATDTRERLRRTDEALSRTSWDTTWGQMSAILGAALAETERSPGISRAAAPQLDPSRD
jgi:UDP-galactopyranose mutase